MFNFIIKTFEEAFILYTKSNTQKESMIKIWRKFIDKKLILFFLVLWARILYKINITYHPGKYLAEHLNINDSFQEEEGSFCN